MVSLINDKLNINKGKKATFLILMSNFRSLGTIYNGGFIIQTNISLTYGS